LKKIIVTILAVLSLFSADAFAENATLYVGIGRAVSNSVSDQKSNAWMINLKQPTSYGTFDFGYLNEGHQSSSCVAAVVQEGPGIPTSCFGDKRDGIFALYEFENQLSKNVGVSFGLGPYFTATTVTEANGVDYHDAYRTDLLAKASFTYSVSKVIDAQASWMHVLYSANDFLINGKPSRGDADVFLLAVGYKF